MNSPNLTPGERDLEALRRAQRAHEPSMEEILASIRSIIADDREPAKPPAPNGPQIVYSKDEFASRVAELSSAETQTPKVVWSAPPPETPAPPPSRPAPEAQPAPEAMRVHAPEAPWAYAPEAQRASAPEAQRSSASDGALLSPQADEAVTAAFEQLSAGLALQSAELAENMTRELLRPMLKTWLDENLPSLVERLVRAEIQRVARGGR